MRYKILKNTTQFKCFFNYLSVRNAGHSKWANIKHQKGIEDKKKSEFATKISLLIQGAIKGRYLLKVMYIY